MTKILFIAQHRPQRSPAQRFRFEQYLSFLREQGKVCEFSFLLDAEADKVFYAPGHFFKKAFILWKAFGKRWRDLRRANSFDYIFIQREAFMLGTSYFEKKFSQTKAKVIFDFDDSIWLHNISAGNKRLAFLKNAEKTAQIIKLSDTVVAGNGYLKQYALRYNPNVTIIPTTIDTEEYKPDKKPNSKICIGWSGSITTIQHFELAIPFLEKIQEKYADQIEIKVIGDGNYRHNELNIQGIAWKKETELQELNAIDIGIMPLPDDEWAKGKCGLKGLQYMALEIPTILSPVGVNSEIIQHGKNGFLATTNEEWFSCIEQLIESKELRTQIGKLARQTVVDSYSVISQRERYAALFT